MEEPGFQAQDAIVNQLEAFYEKLDIHKAILLVDHDDVNMDLITDALRGAAFPAVCVRTTADAFTKINCDLYRLIVMSPAVFIQLSKESQENTHEDAREWCSICNLVAMASIRDRKGGLDVQQRVQSTWSSLPFNGRGGDFSYMRVFVCMFIHDS